MCFLCVIISTNNIESINFQLVEWELVLKGVFDIL